MTRTITLKLSGVLSLLSVWGCNAVLGIDKPRARVESSPLDAGTCLGANCSADCGGLGCATAAKTAAKTAVPTTGTVNPQDTVPPKSSSTDAPDPTDDQRKPSEQQDFASTDGGKSEPDATEPVPAAFAPASGANSGVASSDPAVAASSSAPAPECTENTYQCDGIASVTRRVCTTGKYQTAPACSDGKLCDASRTGADTCQPVPTPCIGHSPGESFCEGAKRVTCSSDLLTVTTHDCKNTQYCAQGNAGECAACVDGEYTCDGNTLKKCNAQHSGFATEKTCAAGECNALAGACSKLACQTNQKRCGGDTLFRCADDQMTFDVTVSQCGAGLCDANNFVCDVCQAGLATCKDGGTRSLCSSDGSSLTTPICPSGQPHCLGSGTCVECRNGADCGSATECATPACNAATNKCVSVPRTAGDACSTGQCDGAGSCVQCVSPSACTPTNACYVATCGSNRCGNSPLGKGQDCSFSGGRFCDGAGSCVECTADSQCSSQARDVCHVASCTTGNKCAVGNAPARNACSFSGGRMCDGAGNCVSCLKHSDCASTEYCSASNQCAANTSFDVGHSSVVTGQSYIPNVGSDTLWATRVRTPAGPDDYKLDAIGMVGKTGNTSQVRLAVYEDNGTGNAPGRYLAWTGDIASGTGITTAPSREARSLSPDTYYWVAAVWAAANNSTAQYTEANGAYANVGQLYSTNLSAQGAFPSPPDINGSGLSLGLFIRVSRKTM